MQDGVHGRCGDLRLCHYHLFTKSFESVPLRPLFFTAGWCAMCMAGAVTPAFAIFNSSQNLLKLFLYDLLFYTAGWCAVHGRCGDLRICHLYLFKKSFDTVPLRSYFLSCRMVCMAGAVTSAFAIFISSLYTVPLRQNLLKLSLYDPLFLPCRMVCMAGAVT
jgi:hypothetical protein